MSLLGPPVFRACRSAFLCPPPPHALTQRCIDPFIPRSLDSLLSGLPPASSIPSFSLPLILHWTCSVFCLRQQRPVSNERYPMGCYTPCLARTTPTVACVSFTQPLPPSLPVICAPCVCPLPHYTVRTILFLDSPLYPSWGFRLHSALRPPGKLVTSSVLPSHTADARVLLSVPQHQPRFFPPSFAHFWLGKYPLRFFLLPTSLACTSSIKLVT